MARKSIKTVQQREKSEIETIRGSVKTVKDSRKETSSLSSLEKRLRAIEDVVFRNAGLE